MSEHCWRKGKLKDHSGQIQSDFNQNITPTKAIPTKPPTKAEIIITRAKCVLERGETNDKK
jgi:hypothetical protein